MFCLRERKARSSSSSAVRVFEGVVEDANARFGRA
jgi:hypothetical protein